ncbi:DUF3325 domain-containing protein [Roseateles sp. BYS180W]|uniref:DUF3325 domain-containing protein n=1 Tax=Roseateles rivi TaxID=3299028 RepID=A0ABW7FYK6_9BURK
MLELHASTVLLLAAVLCSVLGMACLALSQEAHWLAVLPKAQALNLRQQRLARVLGGMALLGAALLCGQADHISMAVLVWPLLLSAAAGLVAFSLSWRPRSWGLLAALLRRC